jgi:hypothetical protein
MLGRGSAAVAFAVGAVVSFPASAIWRADHIAKLNPPTVPILLLVLYFCLMQQILLELPVLTSLFTPDRRQDIVVRSRPGLRHGRCRSCRFDFGRPLTA